MIDIKLIRENKELVKENIKKKFQDEKIKLVDEIIKKDKENRKLMKEAQELRHKRNDISKKINEYKKNKKDITNLVNEAKQIPIQIKEIEEIQKNLELDIEELLKQIPNIIHKSVPIGKDDKENVEIEKFGKIKEFDFKIKSHSEILESLNLADFETASNISGNGFYILKSDLALLNMALINFARDFMIKKGYNYYEPPLMIRKEVLDGVYSNEEINEQSYKIKNEDLYLIATSEHPLIGMFINKTIDKKDLPIKITGYSVCFRKEIGSHGIDEKGLFRTHQFHKQEMIVICEPKDSYKYYDEMINLSIDLFKQLEIPIRHLECCSGDLGDLKAKSADLEAWSPRKNGYIEITSCTNMEEAQARRLNIKILDEKNNRYFAHTLNNTAIATSRALVAIVENFQNKDGSVNIPKVLWPYMNGIKKLTLKK
ncbi:MAG: serine--tRNA ligase [Nanoarchaeota archaeon]